MNQFSALSNRVEYDDFKHKPRQLIPMARIIRFAVATAMRQEEICKFEWADVDIQKRLVTVRDRKDPVVRTETISVSRCSI